MLFWQPATRKAKAQSTTLPTTKNTKYKNRLHKTVNVCIDFYKNLVTTTPNLATIHTIAVSQVLNYLVSWVFIRPLEDFRKTDRKAKKRLIENTRCRATLTT